MYTGETRAFIGGEFIATANTFALTSPYSGQVVAQVADCDASHAQSALEKSVAAFAWWSKTTAYERAALLKKFHALVLRDEQEIARVIALEMGKPVTEALGEVRYAAGFIEWYAEEAKRVYGETLSSQFAHKRLFALRQPVGAVYAVTPWNFPAAMVTRKLAPALAAGCTMVLKPAEQSPLTALKLAQLWLEAGGHGDVFQVLPTNAPAEVSSVFMRSEQIRKITFTGSTEVGKILTKQAADTLKRVSMELGGHAPYLIFEDADLEQAVRDVVACKFRNAGQTCVCTNRVYVQSSVLEAFSAKLAQAVARLNIGDPLEPSTQIGPLVDAAGLEKVKRHVEDALQKGATVLTGGAPLEGLMYQPTVLSGVRPDMLILQEETFGPVAPIIAFESEAEAIAAANNTPFGLAAYIWTRDIARAVRVTESLEYGIIGLNDAVPSTVQAPFGGVKQSGYGREGGHWGLDEYLFTKFVSLGI
ncbi:MAG: NAD-dependent succinate-semialdehyde dehydrogenase [Deinococcales bacterium]